MKPRIKVLFVVLLVSMSVTFAACGGRPVEPRTANSVAVSEILEKPSAPGVQSRQNEKESRIKIKVTVSSQVLTATLIDNATTRDLIAKFPLTVPMKNLYSREMVYRFTNPLPANEPQQSGYEVGDLAYWTPGHSLVIFYAQNGEVISNLQKIGRFDSGLDFFKSIEATDVRFELLKE